MILVLGTRLCINAVDVVVSRFGGSAWKPQIATDQHGFRWPQITGIYSYRTADDHTSPWSYKFYSGFNSASCCVV